MPKPIYFFAAALLLALTSCAVRDSRYVYAAQAANVPYIKQQGDAKLTGYYSGDGATKNGAFNIQGTYAITNRLFVMGAYTHKTENQVIAYSNIRYPFEQKIYDSSVVKYSRSFFEPGIGYAIPLGSENIFNYTIAGGFAFGRSKLNDNGLDTANHPYTRFYNNSSVKPWVQGAFNYMAPGGIINFSLGGKFSWLRFSDVTTTYDQKELNYFYLDKLNDRTFILWEPYFNVQVGVPGAEWIKLDMQVAASTSLGPRYPKIKPANFSIGLTFDIARAPRQRDAPPKKGHTYR